MSPSMKVPSKMSSSKKSKGPSKMSPSKKKDSKSMKSSKKSPKSLNAAEENNMDDENEDQHVVVSVNSHQQVEEGNSTAANSHGFMATHRVVTWLLAVAMLLAVAIVLVLCCTRSTRSPDYTPIPTATVVGVK